MLFVIIFQKAIRPIRTTSAAKPARGSRNGVISKCAKQ